MNFSCRAKQEHSMKQTYIDASGQRCSVPGSYYVHVVLYIKFIGAETKRGMVGRVLRVSCGVFCLQ